MKNPLNTHSKFTNKNEFEKNNLSITSKEIYFAFLIKPIKKI